VIDDDTLVGAVLSDSRDKMAKAIGHTQHDFATVRTGRASPAAVEDLKIEYYGTQTPLKELAQIKVPEPRLLVIAPHDKNSMGAIEKAIQHSDLGINPSNDGQVIRLSFPQLTEERRKELVKVVKHKAEDGRVAVRNLRRAARHELEGMEKNHEISSDELDRAEKELEKVTHDYVAEIARMLQHKERELLEVFGIPSTRYYQLLNELIDRPEAMEFDPALVTRLRRQRARRHRMRTPPGGGQ